MSELGEDGHPIGWAAILGEKSSAARPTRPAGNRQEDDVITRKGELRRSSTSKASRSTAKAGSGSPSEGDTAALTPHALFHVDAEGEILEEVGFPAALLAGQMRLGSEGVALIGGTPSGSRCSGNGGTTRRAW